MRFNCRRLKVDIIIQAIHYNPDQNVYKTIDLYRHSLKATALFAAKHRTHPGTFSEGEYNISKIRRTLSLTDQFIFFLPVYAPKPLRQS